MRFMWQSNAPWAGTGYGTQTKLVLKGLLDRGHEPRMFAFYGLGGGIVNYDGYPVYPNSDFEPWGNDVIKAHILKSESEAVLTLIDIWVLNQQVWSQLPVPWVGWVPIDCVGMGREQLERLKIINYPVAMSYFGAEEMMNVGVEPADVIYHAVDTDVFRYMELDERQEVRKELGIEQDAYIVGMVMANKGDRKQYPNQLLAISKWMADHKDENIKVFIHCDPTSSLGGWDMKTLVQKMGLEGKVYSTAQYETSVVPVETEMMAKIYNCFDVLLNCSSGEGFGIPIVEAQSCGVPVIAQGVTAMPELVHNGYCVETAAVGLGGHYGWQFIPDAQDIAYRLESVYRMSGKEHNIVGREWVKQNCGVDIIVDKWHRLLAKVEADLAKKDMPIEIQPEAHVAGPISDNIKLAREAMAGEAEAYGNYNIRTAEYELIADELFKLGLKNGDRILDVGAAFGDMGRYLITSRQWYGTYVPVDMIIDGTDLRNYEFPEGFNFIILEQVIEHVENWQEVLDKAEAKAGGLVVATPNKEEIPEHDKHDFEHQMAHVVWLSPEDFESRGYRVSTYSLSGYPRDTIVASKVCNLEGDDGILERGTSEAVLG